MGWIRPTELLHEKSLEVERRHTVSQFGGAGLGVTGADYVGSGAVVMVIERDLEEAIKILEPMIEELPGNSDSEYHDGYDE